MSFFSVNVLSANLKPASTEFMTSTLLVKLLLRIPEKYLTVDERAEVELNYETVWKHL